MNYSLPWSILPPESRIGQSFDERIRLFRGDKIGRLETVSRSGILSSALEAGDYEKIYEFENACAVSGLTRARQFMTEHITMGAQKEGSATPFVSATPFRNMAERFAQNPDEAVVEFEVPVSRTIAPPINRVPGHLPLEILVVGGVMPEEIVQLH